MLLCRNQYDMKSPIERLYETWQFTPTNIPVGRGLVKVEKNLPNFIIEVILE